MPLALGSALLIGTTLGLLGSGGSILTVPVLVYILGQADKVAVAGSLAIVGGISLLGSIPFALRRLIDWRSVLLFGLPGMLGSYLGAALSRYISGTVQLVLFGVIMLVAAAFMLRKPTARPTGKQASGWLVATEGLAVGVITGLVGVGGGFLIVPALALLGGLPLHLAVGTSLLIIALKSAVGLVGYLPVLHELELQLNWLVITMFIIVGAAGSFLGARFGRRIPQLALQRVFALFLVGVGSFVLWQNLV